MPLFKLKKRSIIPVENTSTSMPLLFTAETNPTVAACVNKIANTFAVLTPHLYVHTKQGQALATGRPLFYALENPSVEESPSLFYGTMVRHMLLAGNAYLYKLKDEDGNVVGFNLMDPHKVEVRRMPKTFQKYYVCDDVRYTADQVLQIPYPGAGYNGTKGVSPVRLGTQLIELSNQLHSYIDNYFNNSPGSRLAIELGQSYGNKPGDTVKTYAALMPVIKKFVSGASNAGSPMVTPPDTKISEIKQTSNAEAELHSLLAYVNKQIAESLFNIPYEVISSEASKYGSLEQKQNDYLSNCIQVLGDHICQCLVTCLGANRRAMFVAYEYKSLLKTDAQTHTNIIISEVNNGLLSLNEARRMIGKEDIGEFGDVFRVQANTLPIDYYEQKIQAQKSAETEQEHEPAGDDK